MMHLRRETVYVTAFAVVAAYFLVWPVWRAQFLLEIWPTEGWNAYFQDAAARGRQLYPPLDALIGNNYPPLSFYAVGALGKIFGDNLFVGRVLSIVAVLGLAVEIFYAVRILGGSAIGGVIGALWYVAFMAHNATIYVGANDPQLFGQAIMGAALVWFLARDRDGQSTEAPLVLMVAAGFWKHNIVGIPVAAIGWLLARHGRSATRPVLVSAVATGAGLLLCVGIFGPEFLANLMANREHAWAHVVGNLGHLQWTALAFVIWAGWAWSDRTSMAARFTALHVVASLIACILQWFGHGVSGNAEFDLIIALGIGTGVAFSGIKTTLLAQRFGVNRTRDLMIAALILRLVISDRQEPALLVVSPDFVSTMYANQQIALKEAGAIAAIKGDVACSNKVVCRQAGKPFVVDEFKMEELVATGKATDADVAALIKSRGITPFKNDPRTGITVSTSLARALRKPAAAF